MGYYTQHNLEVRNVKSEEEFDKLREAMFLHDCPSHSIIGYALDSGYYSPNGKTADFYSYGECKWYDHEVDMLRISREFPDMVFCLHCEGEESGDLWDDYYRNGMRSLCQAEVVYPDPDPEIGWDSFKPGKY